MAAVKSSGRRRARPNRSSLKLNRSRAPQTSLVHVSDALATICATVDVAASALTKDENETLAINAGQVLLEHVYEPLWKQKAVIEAHAKHRSLAALATPHRDRKPKGRRGVR